MTDQFIVNSFAGAYRSDGWVSNSDPTKAQWFPVPGVVMELVPQEDSDGWHIKIELKEKADEVPHRVEMQAARYSVIGDKLISTPMKLANNLEAIEVLSLNDATAVMHKVIFSDGVIGFWRCPK